MKKPLVEIDQTVPEKTIVPVARPPPPPAPVSNENRPKKFNVEEIVHLIDSTDLVFPCDQNDRNRMRKYEFELNYVEEHLFRS